MGNIGYSRLKYWSQQICFIKKNMSKSKKKHMLYTECIFLCNTKIR